MHMFSKLFEPTSLPDTSLIEIQGEVELGWARLTLVPPSGYDNNECGIYTVVSMQGQAVPW